LTKLANLALDILATLQLTHSHTHTHSHTYSAKSKSNSTITTTKALLASLPALWSILSVFFESQLPPFRPQLLLLLACSRSANLLSPLPSSSFSSPCSTLYQVACLLTELGTGYTSCVCKGVCVCVYSCLSCLYTHTHTYIDTCKAECAANLKLFLNTFKRCFSPSPSVFISLSRQSVCMCVYVCMCGTLCKQSLSRHGDDAVSAKLVITVVKVC